MDSLADLLQQHRPEEPPEIAAIKRYVDEHFHATARIALQHDSIVISVDSAALANTLRLRLTELQAAAQTTKRLVFRIG
jgi:hypothetical protein